MNEQELIQNIIGKLLEEGVIEGGKAASATAPAAAAPAANTCSDAPVTLPPLDEVGVDNAHNMAALEAMRKTTPARILMGRCGARQKTHSFLHFQADLAAAEDAVFMDVSDTCLEENGLFAVQTVVKDKDEYLMRLQKGGLGVHLIKKIMDVVEYTVSPGVKNCLKMVKYIRPVTGP